MDEGRRVAVLLLRVSITADCDNDTLLIKAIPAGPVCHTGADTCFGEKNVEDIMFLKYLQNFIERRRQEMPEGSLLRNYLYSAKAEPYGPESRRRSGETVIEVTNGTEDGLPYEVSDLVYHLIVLLTSKDFCLEDLTRELKKKTWEGRRANSMEEDILN